MADEITVGEVYRFVKDTRRLVDSFPEKYVQRREYDKDQQNTDHKIMEVVADLAKTDKTIEGVQKEQATLEKERQAQAAARRWQLFLLVAGPIVTALIGILIVQGQ